MNKELTHREEIRCTKDQKSIWEIASRLAKAKDRASWERETLDNEATRVINLQAVPND